MLASQSVEWSYDVCDESSTINEPLIWLRTNVFKLYVTSDRKHGSNGQQNHNARVNVPVERLRQEHGTSVEISLRKRFIMDQERFDILLNFTSELDSCAPA